MTEEQRAANDFARELEEIYGDELVAVVLYGSAARGDYRQGVSDLNTLVIVKTLELTQIQRASASVGQWVSSGNPPPLMLSEQEWRGSADVFPIEYSDIRDAHVLLAGIDPFTGMQIRAEHLRLQLEHELRSAKIQLREGYLAIGESPERLGALLSSSLPTLLALFRATLRLAKVPVPRAPEAVVEAVAVRADFSATSVLDVLRCRATGKDLVTALDGPIAPGYLQAVVAATSWLDRFDSGSLTGKEI